MRLTHEQLGRLNRLLDEALELEADARSKWLERLPAADEDLRDALREALLKDPAVDLQGLSALAARHLAGEANPLKGGERVGPYLLIRELGQGGMAQVWLAQRADGAFKREVALKVPKLHSERQDLASRFARETDILASLEHPHIARLYDAGVTADGLPYLAMEYVNGRPIDAWCDGRRSTIKERITLFLQVLEAVEYAHRRGVLHRDIKPSNVLVSDDGQVQLLDFGVAKLLESRDTRLTQVYGKALTPAYASPEQISDEEIGLASDVYSLGVLLYELLSGALPQKTEATQETRSSPAPSARIDNKAAQARGATLTQLSRQLTGDLDAVVMKAMAADPKLRYGDAGELAQDLRAYLGGRAVGALPVSPGRHLAKFLRREPMVALAATAVLVALGLGVFELRRTNTTEMGATAVSERSIAVLPFTDMSEKKDQEYFSDGLSEELIDHLSHAPDLKVIARTSSFQFKGKNEDMRAIGQKLGVANLLEGSVRKDGGSIRVTAQLIRVVDGTHLWSRSYDRALNDIFKVQDEIADTVARALKAALIPGQSSHGDAANVEAYNAHLRGLYFLNKGSKEDNQRAQASIQEALRLDPNYAGAWLDMTLAFNRAGLAGWMPQKVAYTEARNAVGRALKLDPMSAAAHHALGALEWNFNFNFEAARLEFLRARELDPANFQYRIQDAAFDSLAMGRAEDAAPYFHLLVDSNPLVLWPQISLVLALYGAGHLAEAENKLHTLLQVEPDGAGIHGMLADILLDQGRPNEALEQAQAEKEEPSRLAALADVYWVLGQKERSDQFLQSLESKYADSDALTIAESYARRGDKNASFKWLDRAYENREPALTLMRSAPELRILEGDSRYKAFLVKMNFAN